jgi:hypothetical protein
MIRAPSFTGGPSIEYVCPAGKIAVVKSLTIVWGNVTISGVDAWFQFQDLTKLARYTWFTSMSAFTNNGGTAQWWGSWALDPGETISVQTAAGTVDFQASGYELTLP